MPIPDDIPVYVPGGGDMNSTDSGIKLSYNAAQRRVRIEFSGAQCHALEEAPLDFINRASAKLESEQMQGNIDHFVTYEERFKKVWQAVRQTYTKADASRIKIVLTLGSGGKRYKWLEMKPPVDDKTAFLLSFNAQSDEIGHAKFDWIKLQLAIMQRKLKLHNRGNLSQIQGAFLRASAGERVKDCPIGLAVSLDDSQGRPYKLLANKARREISLVVFDHHILTSRADLEKLIHQCQQVIEKANQADPSLHYVLQKDNLMGVIGDARFGAESIGLDLPLTILVGVGSSTAGAGAGSSDTAAKAKAATDGGQYPGMGLLKVNVTPDSMQVTAQALDGSVFNQYGFQPSLTWIQKELARLGITSGLNEGQFEKLREMLEKRTDISGFILATGTPARAGRGPYLHLSYRDIKSAGAENVDMRERAAQDIVKTGDLVAEIRYKVPKSPGRDVFGRDVAAADDEKLEVNVGEGVRAGESGRFYATIDGMVVVEGHGLAVMQQYVHKGDINLKSGNIYFRGPTVIKGSIDGGATVMVTGDLLIEGSVGAAFIRCGGNITVVRGVCTTEKGRIQARGDITADFVENSNVTCGGTLWVKRALLNSNVVAGRAIELDVGSGVLAGGTVACYDYIRTGKLGFPKGNITTCNVGVSSAVEIKVRILTQRITNLENALNIDRQNLRELIRKKPAQLTPKHRAQIDELQNRLQRGRGIMDKLNHRLESAKAALVWNEKARILVYQDLVSNVRLTVGGAFVKVSGEVREVMVSAKRKRGSHIVALEEADEEDLNLAG